MQIKSFYGSTVEGAVAQARRALGAEAMLVESRRTPAEARHLGEYEVICALVPEQAAAAAGPAAEDAARPDRLSRELAGMREQLDLLGRTISRSAWNSARGPAACPEMPEWHARLMAVDLDAELAQEILDAASRRASGGASTLAEAVESELRERILAADPPARTGGPSIVALTGPPGAGKTTMLVKLAVAMGLAARRPVSFVSMDDFRVGGADQLRSFAAILGAGCTCLDSVGALAQELDGRPGQRLVLIDTPGYGPQDMDRAAELAGFLSARADIGTHLVLSAACKSVDLTHVAERYEIFQPSSLLFTRIDETADFGTAFSLSVRSGRPISILGTGQEIPEDMALATPERILSLLWPRLSGARRLAA